MNSCRENMKGVYKFFNIAIYITINTVYSKILFQIGTKPNRMILCQK